MATIPFEDEKSSSIPVDVVLALAAAFVVGSVARNRPMTTEEINAMIAGVHRHLVSMTDAGGAQQPRNEEPSGRPRSKNKAVGLVGATRQPQPFVAVSESVHDRYLVCLVCGRRFETLVRHIATSHDLSDVEYRQRFGLPGNYPMICDHYRKVRASLARKLKLGVKKRTPRPTSISASDELEQPIFKDGLSASESPDTESGAL